MSKQKTPKRGVTPPKGRPTRSRDAAYSTARLFGPTAQWIAVTLLIVVLFIILLLVTDGPFGTYSSGVGPAVSTAVAAALPF